LFADFTGEASVPVFGNMSNTFAKLLAQYAAANKLNVQLGWPIEQPDVAALPDSIRVNALDVFFKSVLQKKGLVIYVKREQIKHLQIFYHFLVREMMVGVIPIVFSVGPTLPIENLAVGVTMAIDDSAVVISPSAPLTLLEAVDLPSIMADSVVFN
jgi:hypothetical protein